VLHRVPFFEEVLAWKQYNFENYWYIYIYIFD
jgi:hypothetical protein